MQASLEFTWSKCANQISYFSATISFSCNIRVFRNFSCSLHWQIHRTQPARTLKGSDSFILTYKFYKMLCLEFAPSSRMAPPTGNPESATPPNPAISSVYSGGSRISRWPSTSQGGVDSRGSYVSKSLYVEMKEPGPLAEGGGVRRPHPH